MERESLDEALSALVPIEIEIKEEERRMGNYLIKAVGSFAGVLLFGLLAAASADAQITECKNQLCVHVTSKWNGKKMVKYVSFSGYPRTEQNYVTHFHQVRGLPYPHGKQVEVHHHKEFEVQGSFDVSVQACRRRGVVMIKTYCTRWENFKVY